MRGHVYQRSHRWIATVDVGRDEQGKRLRRSRSFTTKGEADRWAAHVTLYGQGAKKGTVGELVEQWFARAQKDLAVTTVKGYRSKIDQHITPGLGDLPLRKFNVRAIDTFYDALTAKGLSPATVRQVHAILRRACSEAVRDETLIANPAERARLPRARRPERTELSVEVVEKIIANGYGDDFPELVMLALVTGARRGELCGLKWSDVHDGQLTIRRSIADLGRHRVQVTEWRKSKTRVMALDEMTLAMLKARRARAARDALACGVSMDDGYILSEAPGQPTPLRPQVVSGRWRDATKRARVRFRFHDLRHFHATTLIAAGIPIPQVAARMGHSTPNVTLAVYAHAQRALDQVAADAISRAVATARPG